MDWTLAISRNRDPLLRIVMDLFALIGLVEGGTVERLARPLYRTVLGLLQPAEAAVRRLIVVVAKGMVVKLRPPRPAPVGLKRSGQGQGRISFRLFDPRKRFERRNHRRRSKGPRSEPRIRFIDVSVDPRVPLFRQRPLASPQPVPAPQPDDTVSARALCRRLMALKQALDDLPRQARRYARWRDKPFEARKPRLVSTLRPGGPPGFRKDVPHQVHAILHECHWLAHQVDKPDTS
jgi:hypothetical protein